MCGSTGAQDTIQDEQMAFYKQAMDMTAKQYANQQAILKPLTAQFQSIFDRGPSAKGFSDAERADLDSQAITGTAENYKAASKAISDSLAAEGSAPGVGNGAADQIRASVATSAAKEESDKELGIDEADYQAGYDQWLQAGSGLMNAAGLENPLGFEEGATGAGSAASKTANDIAAEDNSWINAAIGAAGSIGEGWATGGFKH